MTDTTSIKASNKWALRLLPVVASILAILISLVLLIVLFLSASEQARHATGTGTFPVELLGLPMFTGFRNGVHFGTHAHLGLLVLPIFIFVVAIGTSIPGLVRFVAADR
jgi:hypothetical protein